MKHFIEKFKAVSDETRLRILNLLILSEESICVCEIVDSLKENQYNISRHLKILKTVGLINENKDGRWKYFCLTKSKDLFITNLFQTISSISRRTLMEDYERLRKRLEIRLEGKCVLGVQNAHLLSRKN